MADERPEIPVHDPGSEPAPPPQRPADPDDLVLLVEQSTDPDLEAFLRILHPADVADLLHEVDRDTHWPRVLKLLGDRRLSDVLVELEGGVQEDLLAVLPTERLGRLVAYMDSDDAADIVAQLPDDARDRIIGALRKRDAEAVTRLLQYEEDTAGGIMQTELASVPAHATVNDAVAEVRKRARELGGSVWAVYVTGPNRVLLGEIPLHVLVIAEGDQKVAEVMQAARFTVTPDVDQEEVAAQFQKYDLVSLPVVDGGGRLLGRILVDDIVDVLEEEATEDVMRMVGADEEDLVYSDRILRISAARLPWLVVNLFGGLLTGWLMWMFKATLGEVLALVTFVPVITGMGGNVGTQSSTILTRGFATGRVDSDNIGRVILKELLVGITMGTACGTVVAGAAMIWHGNPMLGLVVGLSMLAAMTAAATIGTIAPATFKRINVDPAIAAGPFVTTANDITGILIYFGTATLFIEWLVR